MLGKSPGFTAAAVLCLALGIGATTAIFSVVHAVLLRPLGYRDPGRLIRLYTEFPKFPNGGLRRFWTSPPEYYELSHELQSWESLDAWVTAGMNLAGRRGSDPRHQLPGDGRALPEPRRVTRPGPAGDATGRRHGRTGRDRDRL